MKNTQANRERIARMALESMTFYEMEEALIYEISERYKREPGLFDTVVVELEIESELEVKGGE